ncbi:MAG: zinc-ribbon domain-containing protein [Myxococcales bacterium]|nr:zinc-ribbon domain-containing protein [Myxococcales bacterium]
MFCPNCGTQNPDTATTCTKCGFNLKGAAAPKFKGTMLMMNPQQGAAAPKPGAPAAPAVPSAPKPQLKGTMLGVAPPSMGSAPLPPGGAPAPAAPPPAGPPPGGFGGPADPLGGTMVAPPGGAPPGFPPPGADPGFGGPPPGGPMGGPPPGGPMGGPPPGGPMGGPPPCDPTVAPPVDLTAPPGWSPPVGLTVLPRRSAPARWGPPGGPTSAPAMVSRPAPAPGLRATPPARATRRRTHDGAAARPLRPQQTPIATAARALLRAGRNDAQGLPRQGRHQPDHVLRADPQPHFWPRRLEAKQMAGVPNAQVSHPILYFFLWPYFLTADLNEIWQAASGGRQM